MLMVITGKNHSIYTVLFQIRIIHCIPQFVIKICINLIIYPFPLILTISKNCMIIHNEYHDEYFVNAFVNTFLREMNTLNTLRVNSYFLLKIQNITLLVKLFIFNIINNKRKSTCLCVCLQSIHCIHQQIQSIHDSIHKVFIEPFIFGGNWLKCCICDKIIKIPYIKNGDNNFCSWECWINKDIKRKTNIRGIIKWEEMV